jgi:DNA primase
MIFMGKLAPTSIKYVIKAKIKAKGVIEKPDIIGAVFGQTEGLLGSELDLRELQKTGRIGRIEVEITSKAGKSEGEIIIPSALDSAETSLIAATLETIERIGPCEADIKLIGVEDVRSEKRKYVMEKAKEILKDLMEAGGESDEISDEIKDSVRVEEIGSYKGLPAGPEIEESDSIIIVEGRADVINLLKFGIKNTISIGGTGSSNAIVDIANEKTSTMFVDGDRGGKLIVKEIMQKADIDFVAMAPDGKEVEELTQKEVYKVLREKVSADQFREQEKIGPASKRTQRPKSTSTERSSTGRSDSRRSERSDRSDRRPAGRDRDSGSRYSDRGPRRSFDRRDDRRDDRRGDWRDRPRVFRKMEPNDNEKKLFSKTLKQVTGKKSACIFDSKHEMLGKVPVSELSGTLKGIDKPFAVVLDGKVDSSLSFIAKTRGVKFLVGTDKDEVNTPVTILTKKDL